MEGVVNMSVVPASDLNGIASGKGGNEFEFGNSDKTKGILLFSEIVWNRMKNLVKLNTAPNCWYEILDFRLKRPINKFIWSILQRLIIGASIYYIWQERNLRTFQGKVRSIDDICYLIQDAVRLRILGLNLSDSDQVLEAAQVWDFHVERVIGKKKIKFSDGRKNS
ncbi:reverse transcriptase domain, Reverse transcriptase zinc-binding domain protein [Artemisia annua]|uniref:Reverse transcriptase domain, Reverse transcriptase zinc-binding domain protein n=1 Tax=Artemisia annua TaxID=35608 RepID=A0A2U1L9V9_ARTAN|nr:reverse transcriptase domain, Reverse transcriptase zinc-binding domain protein [Artemisia annua]